MSLPHITVMHCCTESFRGGIRTTRFLIVARKQPYFEAFITNDLEAKRYDVKHPASSSVQD